MVGLIIKLWKGAKKSFTNAFYSNMNTVNLKIPPLHTIEDKALTSLLKIMEEFIHEVNSRSQTSLCHLRFPFC